MSMALRVAAFRTRALLRVLLRETSGFSLVVTCG